MSSLAADFDILRLEADGGYWYLGTAYSKYPAGLDAAYEVACRATGRLWMRDVPVFCPIAMCHGPAAFVGYNEETDVGLNPLTPPDGERDLWGERLEPFTIDAIGLLVLKMDGWAESVGLAREIEAFRKDGKPVWFLTWPMLEVVANGDD